MVTQLRLTLAPYWRSRNKNFSGLLAAIFLQKFIFQKILLLYEIKIMNRFMEHFK
nr:MAG TPA: hypothetical protein [Caudoviricetes sp.]